MKIFKFGGASLKNSESIQNLRKILNLHGQEKIVIVVSAIDKTTNVLEELCNVYYGGKDYTSIFEKVKNFHVHIIANLFPDKEHTIYNIIDEIFLSLSSELKKEKIQTYDFIYDQVVSVGEILSSNIVSSYLNQEGVTNTWIDSRNCIKTDNTFREAKVDWSSTTQQIQENITRTFQENKTKLIVLQGFIGSTVENYTTTLGREGSDYSAAIFAYSLNAKEVVIWKDVPGILNADPKYFKEIIQLKQLSYNDAIEMSYYGAKVIHPKTIKPLQNRQIPLYVKSFLSPLSPGTVINKESLTKPVIPCFIFKNNQVLISLSAKDFSFIVEQNLSNIFRILANRGIKINVMQNSAISFSICVDFSNKMDILFEELEKDYNLLYNTDLELITIRHYDQASIDTITKNREVLLEQKSRHTVQLVVK